MTSLALRFPASRVSLWLPVRRVLWPPWMHQPARSFTASPGVRATSSVVARKTRTAATKEEPPVRKTPTRAAKKTPEIVTRAKKTTKKKATEAPQTDSPIPPLSLVQLRDVAVLCGRNTSGTKAVLRSDLEEAVLGEAPATTTPELPQRILSIDMGVRNLAYCLLEADPKGGPAKLIAWERLSLIDEDEAHEADAAANAKMSLFTPPRLAAVAARLVRDRLLALEPTQVLIERQRSRSGGGMAVLEWTMRVNSLEAMLHGIFAYHQASQACQKIQGVEAVSPKRVSVFLLRGGIGDGTSRDQCPQTAATKEKDIKDVKEAFIAGILRAAVDGQKATKGTKASKAAKAKTNAVMADSGPLLSYDERASPMVEAYLIRWDAKQKRLRPKEPKEPKSAAKPKTRKGSADDNGGINDSDKKATVTELLPTLSKIDDLADCVAQGLIWLEWELNKHILRGKGADALLDEKQLPG